MWKLFFVLCLAGNPCVVPGMNYTTVKQFDTIDKCMAGLKDKKYWGYRTDKMTGIFGCLDDKGNVFLNYR